MIAEEYKAKVMEKLLSRSQDARAVSVRLKGVVGRLKKCDALNMVAREREIDMLIAELNFVLEARAKSETKEAEELCAKMGV